MARGQYDLPRTRAPPTFGPQRPPLQTCRSPSSQSSEKSSSQESRAIILLLCSSASTISKHQLTLFRARIDPAATVQVANNADAAINALSRKPSAVIVLDNTMSKPTFERARTEILRYTQNGGRLVTDLSQLDVTFTPTAHYEVVYPSGRHVEYNMHDRMSDLRADHLVS